MARNDPENTDGTDAADADLPHLVTIMGHGIPSSFEITVDGNISMVDADPIETGTIVSGSTAEGAIEVGVTRFRFSGSMANVEFLEYDDPAPPTPLTPEIHVGYNVEKS